MPCFCSHSSEVAAGFLISLYLLVHNLPQLCMHAVIFSVLEFLCLVLLEEMFIWIRALQGRVPVLDPSLFHLHHVPWAGIHIWHGASGI